MTDLSTHAFNLSLEQLVLASSPDNYIRIFSHLHDTDVRLVSSYLHSHEWASKLDCEEQLFLVLLILESESR